MAYWPTRRKLTIGHRIVIADHLFSIKLVKNISVRHPNNSKKSEKGTNRGKQMQHNQEDTPQKIAGSIKWIH